MLFFGLKFATMLVASVSTVSAALDGIMGHCLASNARGQALWRDHCLSRREPLNGSRPSQKGHGAMQRI
jgi:hypothetical protein